MRILAASGLDGTINAICIDGRLRHFPLLLASSGGERFTRGCPLYPRGSIFSTELIMISNYAPGDEWLDMAGYGWIWPDIARYG